MSEQTANLCTTDAGESLRARLAKYEDAEGRPLQPAADLARRIDQAITAFTNGRASMHVPPLDTDVDIVLAECLKLVKGLNSSPVSAGEVDERAANDAHDAALYRYLRDAAHVSLLNKLVRHVELRYGCKWNDEIYGAMSAGLREEVVALKQSRAALTASAPNHSEQVREWVPVSERLPDEIKAEYLCLFDGGHQQVTEWLHDETEGWCFWYGDPTHWMPLPAAPSAGSQGGDV